MPRLPILLAIHADPLNRDAAGGWSVTGSAYREVMTGIGPSLCACPPCVNRVGEGSDSHRASRRVILPPYCGAGSKDPQVLISDPLPHGGFHWRL